MDKTATPEIEIGTGEAARILGVSVETVSLHARRGRLPILRLTVGGLRRFDRAVIERIAASLRAGTPASSAA